MSDDLAVAVEATPGASPEPAAGASRELQAGPEGVSAPSRAAADGGSEAELLSQLRLVSERERIARDLHDTVIQRLFAVGLSIEAASRLAGPDVEERLHQAVRDIDDTIRSIRSSIFGLEVRAHGGRGLRRQVLDVVGDATPNLGFDPSVRFDGPVDTMVGGDVAEQLLATLREALSNVARHARARHVNVVVRAGEDIFLSVDDDGVGLSTGAHEAGHGRRNIQQRAELLGGQAVFAAGDPFGTRLEWCVPLPGPAGPT